MIVVKNTGSKNKMEKGNDKACEELKKENEKLNEELFKTQNSLKEATFFSYKLTHVYKILVSTELTKNEKLEMTEKFDDASDEKEVKEIYDSYLKK